MVWFSIFSFCFHFQKMFLSFWKLYSHTSREDKFSNHFVVFFIWKHKYRKKKSENKKSRREITKYSFYHWECERIYQIWVTIVLILVRVLHGVRCIHCNSTFSSTSDVTLNSYVAILSPICAPRVFYYPVVHSSFCTVSNNSNTMVYRCPTILGKYTLKR